MGKQYWKVIPNLTTTAANNFLKQLGGYREGWYKRLTSNKVTGARWEIYRGKRRD